MYSIKAKLSATAIALVVLSSVGSAASVAFSTDGTKVTGISFSEPITFTATESYARSSLQIRIYDLFPAGTAYANSVVGSGLSLKVGSESKDLTASLSQYPEGDSLGGGPAGDMIIWFSFNSALSFTAGDAVTLSGTASVSPVTDFGRGKAGPPASVSMPTSGTYQAYLISSQNGSEISLPISLQVNPVPEPASGVLAILSVGGLLLRRKRG